MTNKQFNGTVVAATVLLGFLAYANTFAGDWVWDDVSSVLLHEHVHEPGKFFALFAEDQHAFGRGQGNFYRPLVAASFMFDFALSYDPVLDGDQVKGYPDVKPFLFHFSNILWHVAASVLLFFLLGRLGAPRLVQAAAVLLYVLHPMHTEAVAYISGRADMMSATFIFAALLCATASATGRRRWVLLGLSGLCFALGLLCKESTTIYPVLLLVIIALLPRADGGSPDRATWRARSLPLALAVVIVVMYGVLRLTVLKFGTSGDAVTAGLGTRLVETCQAFAFYIKTLFVPTGLHMEQTLAGVPTWTAAAGLVALVVVVGIAVWGYRSGHRRITLGLCWFLAAWLPISGIFPLNAPMAEHWMYVPMAGFWWAVAELLRLAGQRLAIRPLLPAAATLLALLFLAQTINRNEDWRSNEAIFRATLAANPDTYRVHNNLAVTYEYIDKNLPGARRHYEAVLAGYAAQREKATADRTVPIADEVEIRLSLGKVLLRQRDYNEAYTVYSSLMPIAQQQADAAEAAFGMGQSLLGLGEFARANQMMQQALSLDPALAPRYRDMIRGVPLPDARAL